MVNVPYFYDAQIRRIILHFGRLFSGFHYKTGKNADGYQEIKRVPTKYGHGSRQAEHIQRENSENVQLSVPRISYYIQDVNLDRGRTGYQGNHDDLLVTERKFDRDENKYTAEQGNQYHVQRLMLVPLKINFNVDIWVSNQEQKFQLFEQIFMLFNPSLDMQLTSNPLDWTGLQTVELTNIVWDNQSVPKGTDDENEVMTFNFEVTASLSPPAKVKKQTLIHTIIQELGFGRTFEDMLEWDDNDVQYIVTTPGQHVAHFDGINTLTLLGPNGQETDQFGNPYSWPQLIDLYGELRENYSKIALRYVPKIDDDSKDILGYIGYHPTEDNKLIFQYISDTLPIVTLPAVDRIIHPHYEAPGDNLPAPATGQRYIITDEIGPGSIVWDNVDVNPNDIIEFNGTDWVVAFNSRAATEEEILVNNQTGKFLQFRKNIINNNNDNTWVNFIEGNYNPGYFRIFL